MKTIGVLLVMAVCMNFAVCTGSQKIQQIDSDAVNKANTLLQKTVIKENNSMLQDLASGEKELVYYTTQVVAGFSHRMIFKVKGFQSTYVCVRLWERPYSGIKLSAIASVNTIEESQEACGMRITA